MHLHTFTDSWAIAPSKWTPVFPSVGLPRTRVESYTERTCLSFIGMTLKEREWIRLKIKTGLLSEKYSSEGEIQLLPPTWQPVVEPTELSNPLDVGTSDSVGANSTTWNQNRKFTNSVPSLHLPFLQNHLKMWSTEAVTLLSRHCWRRFKGQQHCHSHLEAQWCV